MKYGMNLLLWGSVLGEESKALLEDCKRWGYDGVELPLFELDEANYARIGRECSDLGLGVTAVTVSTVEENPISEDAAVRRAAVERLKVAVDCVAAAGGTHLCGPLHSALGHFVGRGRTEEEWSRAKDVLSEVADHAKTQNVTLVVEYLNRFECYFLNCAADAARFVREVDHSHLKTMYDTFHANIEEKSVTAALGEYGDTLAHIHISENDRSTPGAGDVKWDETFAAIKDIGYDGYLTIEAFGLALPELAAATMIWRRMYESEEQLATEGLAFMKKHTA